MTNKNNLIEQINFGKELIINSINNIKNSKLQNFSNEPTGSLYILENGLLALENIERKLDNFCHLDQSVNDLNLESEKEAIDKAMEIANNYNKEVTVETLRNQDEKEDSPFNYENNINNEFSEQLNSFIYEFLPKLNNFKGFYENNLYIERDFSMYEYINGELIENFSNNGSKDFEKLYSSVEKKVRSLTDGSNLSERKKLNIINYTIRNALSVAEESIKKKMSYSEYVTYTKEFRIAFIPENSYNESKIKELKKEIDALIKENKGNIKNQNFSTLIFSKKNGENFHLNNEDINEIVNYSIEKNQNIISNFSYIINFLSNEEIIAKQFDNKANNEEKDGKTKLKENAQAAAIGAGAGALLKGGWTAFKKSKDYEAYAENERARGRTPMSKMKWLLTHKDVQKSALIGAGIGAGAGVGGKMLKDKMSKNSEGNSPDSNDSDESNSNNKSSNKSMNTYSITFEKIKALVKKIENTPADRVKTLQSELDKIVNSKFGEALKDKKLFPNGFNVSLASVNTEEEKRKVINTLQSYMSKLGNYKKEDYDQNLDGLINSVYNGDIQGIKRSMHIGNSEIEKNLKVLGSAKKHQQGKILKEVIEKIQEAGNNDPSTVVLAIATGITNIKRFINSIPKNKPISFEQLQDISNYTKLLDESFKVLGIKSTTNQFLKATGKAGEQYNSFMADINNLKAKNEAVKVQATVNGTSTNYDKTDDFMKKLPDLLKSGSVTVIIQSNEGNKKFVFPKFNITGKTISDYILGTNGDNGTLMSAVKQLPKKIKQDYTNLIKTKVKQFFFSQYGYYPNDDDYKFKYMCFSLVDKGKLSIDDLRCINFGVVDKANAIRKSIAQKKNLLADKLLKGKDYVEKNQDHKYIKKELIKKGEKIRKDIIAGKKNIDKLKSSEIKALEYEDKQNEKEGDGRKLMLLTTGGLALNLALPKIIAKYNENKELKKLKEKELLEEQLLLNKNLEKYENR